MENEKQKKNITAIIVYILLFVIIIMACNLFILNSKNKSNENQILELKNKVEELANFVGYESAEDVDFVPSDISIIIDKISTVEVSVSNSEENDGEYLNPVEITDENEINQINDILSKAEKIDDFYDKYSEDIVLEDKPSITINTTDGNTCSITAYDGFKPSDGDSMNLIEVYYLDNGDWAMYKVDTKVEELINNLYNENK